MKRPGCVFIVLLLILLPLAPRGNAASHFVKCGTILPSDHPTVQALLTFQEKTRAASADRISIQIFPDGQLGTARELLEGLQFGHIEIGVLPLPLLTSHAPLLATISMPYLFKNAEHRFRVLDGPVGKQILKTLEQSNLRGLGFLHTGTQLFLTASTTSDALKTLQDEPVILLCPDIDKTCATLPMQITQQSLTAMGADVKTASLQELQETFHSQSEEQVILTGESHLQYASSLFQTKELQIRLHELTTVPDVLVVSKQWFNSLSPENREILKNAARESALRQRVLWAAMQEDTLLPLRAQGVTIKTIERNRFYEAVQSVYTSMNAEYGKTWEELLQTIEKIR